MTGPGVAVLGPSMAMTQAPGSGNGNGTAGADAAGAANAVPGNAGAAVANTGAAAPARGTAATAPEPETAPDFAAMLTANAPVDAGTSPSPAEATPGESHPAESAALPAPDQMLALLAGSQAIPAVPQGVPADMPGAAGFPTRGDAPRDPRHVAAAMSLAASALAAAGGSTAPGAAPARAQPGATAPGSMPLPPELAMAGLADGAGAASSGAPSFDTLLAVAPAPPPPPATANPTTTTATTALATPLALPADPDAGFDDGFGARIAWMAEQRLGHAEIRINPDNLGPIDVRVQVDGTRVNAEFHSAHAEVRQALEASVPRLRELLGQQGLQLGQADVGQRQPGGGAAGARTAVAEGADGGAPESAGPLRVRGRGLVDEYA